jgi:hypothetical protein
MTGAKARAPPITAAAGMLLSHEANARCPQPPQCAVAVTEKGVSNMFAGNAVRFEMVLVACAIACHAVPPIDTIHLSPAVFSDGAADANIIFDRRNRRARLPEYRR